MSFLLKMMRSEFMFKKILLKLSIDNSSKKCYLYFNEGSFLEGGFGDFFEKRTKALECCFVIALK